MTQCNISRFRAWGNLSVACAVLGIAMIRPCLAAPIDDLASPDQALRETAAAALRKSYKPVPEEKWAALLDKVNEGISKPALLELLTDLNTKSQNGASGGGGFSESYRLDDEWVLRCSFRNSDQILFHRVLIQDLRAVGGAAPVDFKGTWTIYRVNGQKALVARFRGGKRDGEERGYHPSGKISYGGQYVNGRQAGVWKWFDEEGNVVSEKSFPSS